MNKLKGNNAHFNESILFNLKSKDIGALKLLLNSANEADLLTIIQELSAENQVIIYRLLSKNKALFVFEQLDASSQQKLIRSFTEEAAVETIKELEPDDRARLLDELPASVAKRIIAALSPEEREITNLLMGYEAHTAGRIMTPEYVRLKSNMTVADAFAQIRKTGIDKETIYTCYVTNNESRLIGLVSAKTLFLSDKEKLIEEVMESNVIFSRTNDDREKLIDSFRKYGFIAIPIVDNENRLVGIVTYDDALKVQEEEVTEDFEKMAGMSPSEKPYLKTGIFSLSKNRVPWLFLLNLSVFITGAIIKNFEDALAVLPILVTFIPMLMDTSGDAGSQSSTLIIRGMALGQIKLSNFFTVVWKELRVAFICGGVLATINLVRVVVFGHGFGLALATSLALLTATVLAKTVGAMLPLVAKAIKLDPAVMAGPILTTIVDAATLTVYFSLTMLILRI